MKPVILLENWKWFVQEPKRNRHQDFYERVDLQSLERIAGAKPVVDKKAGSLGRNDNVFFFSPARV